MIGVISGSRLQQGGCDFTVAMRDQDKPGTARRGVQVGVAVHPHRCGRISGQRQLRAPGHHIQRHPRPERRRPATRLPGEDPRRAGLPQPPPP